MLLPKQTLVSLKVFSLAYPAEVLYKYVHMQEPAEEYPKASSRVIGERRFIRRWGVVSAITQNSVL